MMTKFILFMSVSVLVGSADAATVVRGPYLQSAASGRMTICWRTDVPTTSEIAYSPDPEGPFAAVTVAGNRIDHAVAITGLDPQRRYFYQVRGTPESGNPVGVGGANHWFRTAPPPGVAEPTRIWVVGDSGYQFTAAVNVYNAYLNQTKAAGKETSAFLMLGDNAYDIGTDNQLQGALFNRYFALLRNTPLWSAFGNHDGYSVPFPYTAPTPHEAAFHFPSAGECGGVPSGSERYYSFKHSNIHFICLDSFTPGISNDTPGGPYGMVDWLADDLRASDADWIIAFMHVGPYSKASHHSDIEAELIQTRAHVTPLLESFGADLVLYGHSHVYERSGLIDGHYGMSATWTAGTMTKWPGNGSTNGGVDTGGEFRASLSSPHGSYKKPQALARSGTVYAVVGASSSPQGWYGGSAALVNPSPHPAHLVSLNLTGSMVVEVDGLRLRGQYLDETGAIRDDFTIEKGTTYTLEAAAPTTDGNLNGIAFPVIRTGYTGTAEQVPVAVDVVSGSGVTPTQGLADFAIGQSSALVKFFPAGVAQGTRIEARLLPTLRAMQPGAAQRNAYQIAGSPQPGQFGTSPSGTWFASEFGVEPTANADWAPDTDNDGLCLLMEYALGGEPGRGDSHLLPRIEPEGSSLVFRYTRPHGRTDVIYKVSGSESLATWSSAGLVDAIDGPVSALGEPRKIVLPAGSTIRFLRLEVSLLP
jgi:hypothetical protein